MDFIQNLLHDQGKQKSTILVLFKMLSLSSIPQHLSLHLKSLGVPVLMILGPVLLI